MNTVHRIERIFAALLKIDSRSHDFRIAKSEFDRITDDKQALSHLTGKNVNGIQWEDFRDRMMEYHAEYGMNWNKIRGPYGPIELASVELIDTIGDDLARKYLEAGIRSGNFNTVLDDEMPNMAQYLTDFNNDYSTSQAKAGFANALVNNVRYKFNRRSLNFDAGLEKYTYRDDTAKKNEYSLGEKIKLHLKKALQLNHLVHSQEGRQQGKYQNVDFEGIRIKRRYNDDEVLFYNFEVKTSNSIETISDAISQAINYKEFSNFTYIIIPLFDPQNFYDPDRYNSFVKLALENEIGILSIDIDSNSDEIKGVTEIHMAPKREVDNPERLLHLLQDSRKEFCPLCRKVVSSGSSRDFCGWKINLPRADEAGEDSNCMKLLMDEQTIERLRQPSVNSVDTQRSG